MQEELIHDWNRSQDPAVSDKPAGPFMLDDETLRDGLQSPSVTDPSLEWKKRLLGLMDELGIDTADVGLPGAGPRAVADVEALCHEIADQRLKIQPNNPSFHPIAGPGQNPNVPSLISPWTEQSIIGCGDCHNSSSAVSVGGGGPEGPHGSAFDPILVRNYATIDNTPESASNYALCYECHSRTSILDGDSFKDHRKHIDGEDTPCNACHAPHGISATQGNSTNNSNLINFDTSIVFPNKDGLLRFEDQGLFSGTCYLDCHGKDHDNKDYKP